MRTIKYAVLVFVCGLIYLMAYLAINNFHSEGVSFKTCILMAAPLFIWTVYQRVNAISEKLRVTSGNGTSD